MKTNYEVLIVGAGPAGLQLGYFLKKQGIDYAILDRAANCGSTFEKFPRHGQLISINKVNTGIDDAEINLRWDWNSLLSEGQELNFSDYSKDYFPKASVLVDYLNDFKAQFNLKIHFNQTVQDVSMADGEYKISTETDAFSAKRLVVATGLGRQNKPDVEGINLAIDYADMDMDKGKYENKRVMIIGKGNSAFETADDLNNVASVIHLCSPNPIKLAWNTHYVGHVRAVNNNVLDTYQLKSQNTILDGDIDYIRQKNGGFVVGISYSHANGQKIEVPVDHVINCAGFSMDTSMFGEACMPEMRLNNKFPKMTEKWESVNNKNMFFCGINMHSRDYRKTFSGFIHGFRYNCAILAKLLAKDIMGTKLPSETIAAGDNLYLKLMDRIHKSSSLFQQPAFICDVIQFSDSPEKSSEREYFQDVTFDILSGSHLFDIMQTSYMTLSIEYGKQKYPDMFDIPRNPENGAESAFIHPVFRIFKNGEMIEEFHLPEDLENNWYQSIYQTILTDFLETKVLSSKLKNKNLIQPSHLQAVTEVI